MQSASEQLTTQFYQWELLGRGWIRSEDEIELEAPFTPFFGHFLWKEPVYVDDGFQHSVFSKLGSLLKPKKVPEARYQLPAISYDSFLFENDEELLIFQCSFQKGTSFPEAMTEQFFSMLSYCTNPISFELIGTPEKITVQLSCRESDGAYVQMQLRTYFPTLKIQVGEDAVDPGEELPFTTVDFGLEQEFMRPINTHHSIDSLTSLFALLEHAKDGERIIYQVLFNGLINKWESSILRSVSDAQGKSFFADAPEMTTLAKAKIAKPLLAVCVRTIVFAQTATEAMNTLQHVGFAIKKTFASPHNSLIHLSDVKYGVFDRLTDILYRRTHRLGMLLNVEELSTLAHFPSVQLQTKKLLVIERKTKLPSFAMPERGIVLGKSEDGATTLEVKVSSEQRLKHTHIIGATGTGKSTLLTTLIAQDIAAGNGIAVLDPHGDLIESVLSFIPEKRISDVVIIDPSDSEYPIGFNILQAHSEIEKETLCSDLVAAFKRLSTSWGDQMHSVLSNAILAFLESSKGGTLIDLRRFLLEPSFRNEFLQSVNDYHIHYYWQKQYPLLKSGSIGPILTRLDTFLRSRLIRNMVAQQRGIDFEHLLNSSKIILIKLSQGLIGEENSYLLGSFIVSKLHQAALSRQAITERKDFFFYIDEFQHFSTPSMAAILSGARKYHLGLVLAHQDMQQLARGESDIASSVLSNAATRICFRLSETDAKKLSEGFSSFEAQDFQNLNRGEAIARIEKPEHDFSLTIVPALSEHQAAAIKEQVIAQSRATYASTKDSVEEMLYKSIELPSEKAERTRTENKQSEKSVVHFENDQISIPKGAHINTERHSIEVPDEVKEEITQNLIKKKEQSQHRYLQNLIKRLAEAKGYKATIEAPLPSRDGKVDVLLEKEGNTIACEISVTTDTSWELHNIQKCLKANYNLIISCMQDTKSVALFTQKIEATFSKTEQSKIKVFDQETLMLYLYSLERVEMQRKTTFKGYRVKVTHTDITNEEQKYKKDAVARVIGQSMHKMKK